MNKNIVALTGGKNKKTSSDEETEYPKLIIDGEEYELGSFVLSGEGPPPHNKRLLFTWNCSLDEMISFTKVLDVIVNRKVDEAISD